MTEKELQARGFDVLTVVESLRLHRASASAIFSLYALDRELFAYHAKEYIEAIFDTLKNDVATLQSIAEEMLEEDEQEETND